MEKIIVKAFYLKKKIIFPYCMMTVQVKPQDPSGALKKGDRVLALTVSSTISLLFNRNKLATLSEVVDVQSGEKGMKLLLKGLARVRVASMNRLRYAQFDFLPPQIVEPHGSMYEELRKKSQELIFLINVEESDKLINLMNYIYDLNQMTDFIANYFVMDFPSRFRLYREIDVNRRSHLLIAELSKLINKLNMKGKKSAYEKNSNRK
jgi:ATP-dependent Lon protease